MGFTHKDYATNLMLATSSYMTYDAELATLLYEYDPYVFLVSEYFDRFAIRCMRLVADKYFDSTKHPELPPKRFYQEIPDVFSISF